MYNSAVRPNAVLVLVIFEAAVGVFIRLNLKREGTLFYSNGPGPSFSSD